MWAHHAWLALRSLRRNPVLTALAVLMLGLGVAAAMSSLTLWQRLAADPMPGHSQRLFVPQFDNRPPADGSTTAEAQLSMGYLDADALLRRGVGERRSALYGVAQIVTPARAEIRPFFGDGLATTADFFPMFQAPFAAGGPWSAADDAAGAEVVVVTAGFAQRLFGGAPADALGQRVEIGSRPYRVVGVLAPWRPMPRLWRLAGASALSAPEDFMLPFRTAIAREMTNNGWTSCSGTREAAGWQGFLRAECNWIEFWVEADPAAAPALRQTLREHVADQRRAGRMQRGSEAWLATLPERARQFGVVGDDVKLQVLVSLAFLLACLVNVVCLMAARFASRSGEIAVRRALGASRARVLQQFLIEAGVVGLAGALLGAALTYGGLALMARRGGGMDALAVPDAPVLLATVAVAVASALLAGLWPTWRAAGVRPALRLKAQ